MLIDFFVLTYSDPSDPHLKDPNYSTPDQQTTECHRCKAVVSASSHHCTTCQRCVDNFDHHCVFLNNCIGGQNYSIFGRFLISMIVHMTLGIAIGFAMFFNMEDLPKWLSLVYVILNFIVLIEVGILAMFHCYLSFCLYKTTL